MAIAQKITSVECQVTEEFNFPNTALVKDIAFLKKEVKRLVAFKHKKENDDASIYPVLLQLVELLPTLYSLTELLKKESFVAALSKK